MSCGLQLPTCGGIYDAHPCIRDPGHKGDHRDLWGHRWDGIPSLFGEPQLCVIFEVWGPACGHARCDRTAHAARAERLKLALPMVEPARALEEAAAA